MFQCTAQLGMGKGIGGQPLKVWLTFMIKKKTKTLGFIGVLLTHRKVHVGAELEEFSQIAFICVISSQMCT